MRVSPVGWVFGTFDETLADAGIRELTMRREAHFAERIQSIKLPDFGT
jgi:hypothetical protein